MAKIKFGRIFKRTLSLAGITQIEMAEQLGVAPQFISGIVTGRFSAPRNRFDTICSILKKRINDIDMSRLSEAFVEEKIDDEGCKESIITTKYEEHKISALEMLFLKKFELLIPEQQIKVMNTIEQLERDNEFQQKTKAGIVEQKK